MEWVRENWLFIVFALLFIAMHFFGYGCGGHRGHGSGQKEEKHAEHVGADSPRQEGKAGEKGSHGCC